MSENSNESTENKVILYDISTYNKWISEINLSKDLNVFGKNQKNQINNKNYLLKFASWIKNRIKFGNNENSLKFISNSSKPWNQWKLAVSKNVDLIAVLQENFIELYHEFDKLLWGVEIKTQFVKVCNLFFNSRGDMLIFTDENGSLCFFDITDGTEILKYNEEDSIEFENAICYVYSVDVSKYNPKGVSSDVYFQDFLIDLIFAVTYSGYFNVYTVSTNKTVTKISTQSLLGVVPNGVHCAQVDSNGQYLIVGSFASSSYSTKNFSNGLFLWRFLNTEPWIKNFPLNTDALQDLSKMNKNLTKMNFSKIEYVTKLEINEANSTVAAIYVSGKISIYSLPSMRLLNEWFMTEQPNYNEFNSETYDNPYEFKKFKQIYSETDFRVNDIGWWSNNVLIMTRGTGMLSLSSIEDLSSLMGRNQQWFSPFPSIYPHFKNGFIILDCSCSLSTHNVNNDLDLSDSKENLNELSSDDEDLDDDEDSWYSYVKEALKSQAYNLSGIEFLKSPPKKPKFLKRKFTLIHFKSTTPEELFERKLNMEEYGEALQLAKTYNLDTDLVYQKQWRSKPISKSTINDYLSKIKKRSWILKECLERVSPNIDTTKYLIEFGLRGTDLDSLAAITEADDNRFVYSQKIDVSGDEDENDDKFNPLFKKRRQEKIEQLKNEKLSKIDVKNLNSAQKKLCAERMKLLTYMDRLNVYEEILGGASKAADFFEPTKFQQIRTKRILDVAIDYAREGDAKAVEILFTYFEKELKERQLEILGNFPETLSPDEYSKLLPRIEKNEVKMFEDWEELREEKDWIEESQFSAILAEATSSADEKPKVELSMDLIESWYHERTLQIENLSGLVDVALEFAELAIANNCRNMSKLLENLRTLYTLTYQCKTADSPTTIYTLDFVMNLTELEKLTLIMSHSFDTHTDSYTKNLQDWLVPFITRKSTLNEREVLLRSYLLKVSIEDLNPCHKLLQLKLKQAQILADINLTQISLDCLYANEKEGDELCASIIADIQNGQAQNKLNNQEQTKQIKNALLYLKSNEVFKKYGLLKPLVYVKKSSLSAESCREALVKLTKFASSKRQTPLKLNDWIELMKDLQQLQNSLYKHLISLQECTEIFLSSLLSSQSLENIRLSVDWLRDVYRVDREAAIQLAIRAAVDYFNSAANYTDLDMDLAKACLNLARTIMQEANKKVSLIELAKEDQIIAKCLDMIDLELDLINAMKIINDLDYLILPIQVRLAQNRFEIVKDLLNKNKQNFKFYEKILQMAKMLKVSQNESMLLIGEKSLDNSDLFIAAKMCNSLIKANFSPAWKCVYRLSGSLGKLVCTQLKIDVNNVDNDLNMLNLNRNRQEESKTVFELIRLNYSKLDEKNVRNLADMEKFLSFVLTHCDPEFIESILNEKLLIERTRRLLTRPEMIKNQPGNETGLNKLDLSEFNFNYFFNDLIYLNEDFDDLNDRVEFLMNTLNSMKNERQFGQDFIYDLNSLLKLDLNLSIGFMLELTDSDLSQINNLLDYTLFNTEQYELILYLLTLNLYQKYFTVNSLTSSSKSFIYALKSSTLNRYLDNGLNLPDHFEADPVFLLFLQINKKYSEFKLSKELAELNAGIDMVRFEKDLVYKNETILGLSMDLTTFDLSCSLAKFYEFDLWKVYVTHVKYLMTENDVVGLSVEEVEKKIAPLMTLLKTKPAEFDSQMFAEVLPLIDGRDLNKLSLFYSTLNTAESDLHMKSVKKITTMSLFNFDYKKFVEKPLEILDAYLDEVNLQFFAKLLPKLNPVLTSSKVYIVWCLKKFWSDVTKSADSEWSLAETNHFLDKFDNLNDTLKKLDLDGDFMFLINDLLISERSIEKLNVQMRRELIKKINKFLKQSQQQSNKQLKNDEKLEKINNELNLLQNHLKIIEDLEKSVSGFRGFIKRLDLSLGRKEALKVQEVLVDMLLDGFALEKITSLISAMELENTDVKLLIKMSLVKICGLVKEAKIEVNVADEENEPSSLEMKKLRDLLESISAYLNKAEVESSGGKKKKKGNKENVPQGNESIMECMRMFCNDTNVDLNIRLFILEEMKKSIKNMKDDDLMILLVYKTNAVLDNCGRFEGRIDYVTSSIIQTEADRLVLINDLLDLCTDLQHFNSCIGLIKIWPKFVEINETSKKPWNNVLIKMIQSKLSVVNFVKELNKLSLIDDDDVVYVKGVLEADEKWPSLRVSFLKLALAYKNKGIIKKTVQSPDYEFLKEIEEPGENRCLIESMIDDQEMMELIIEDKFYCHMINTPLYSIFTRYLLKHKSIASKHEIIRTLKQNDFLVEAANLLIETEQFCEPYRTISAALAMIEKLA